MRFLGLAASLLMGAAVAAPEAGSKFVATADLDAAGFPSASAWQAAPRLEFAHDWRGQALPPPVSTQVQILNSRDTIFLRFSARYQSISVYPAQLSAEQIYPLWERDVVEVFLQPASASPGQYREIEVAPNGLSLDIAIDAGRKQRLLERSRARAQITAATSTWTAELAIPGTPPLARDWRINFFRVEGPSEPRIYSSWSPTLTPKPNFHVPAAFGHLLLDLPETAP